MYIKKILEAYDLKLVEYACCNDNNYIYIFGGEYGNNRIHTNDTYKYDIKNNSLIKLNTINTPEKRRGMQSIIYNNKMYIFGGQFYDGNTSIRYNDVWYLDLFTLRWTKINTTIPETSQHNYSLVVNNDTVYIINLGWYSGHCWKYNISKNSWERLADIPDKLLYSGAVIYNNKIYVICGYHWTSNNDQYYVNKLFVYDILKNNWVTKNLPSDCKSTYYHGNGGFILNDKLYFGAKSTSKDSLDYKHLWYYDIQNDIFVKTETHEYDVLIEHMINIDNCIYCLTTSKDKNITIYKIYNSLFLLEQNNQYYTLKSDFYKNGEYEPITELEGKEILTQNDFAIYGINDLNLLTKPIDTQNFNGINKGNLGSGKYFEIMLNKDIKKIINTDIDTTKLKDLIPLLTSNNSNGFTISTNSEYDKDLVYKLFDKNLSTTVRFYRNYGAGGDIFIKFPYSVKIKKVQISDGTIRYAGLGNLKYYTNNSSVQFNYTNNNNNNYIINSDVNVDYISLNVYSGNQGDPIYIPEIYIYGEYFYKFLIKYNSQLYTFDGTNIALSSSQILDEINFIDNGFDNVTSIAEEQWNITFPNKSDLKLLMWTDDMGKTDVSIEIGVIPFRPIDKLKKNSDICNILFNEA
ncbi:TPA: hypothetical protein PTV31_003094 [Clostridium botulinum]|nr:hypothetical protein [Clostridium botulinum]